MAKNKPVKRDPLFIEVLVALGAGHVSEGSLDDPGYLVSGYTLGNHVWINPAPDVVDSLVHELIHRLRPHWKEPYVKGRTTRILKSISRQELDALYTTYLATVKRRKSPLKISDD